MPQQYGQFQKLISGEMTGHFLQQQRDLFLVGGQGGVDHGTCRAQVQAAIGNTHSGIQLDAALASSRVQGLVRIVFTRCRRFVAALGRKQPPPTTVLSGFCQFATLRGLLEVLELDRARTASASNSSPGHEVNSPRRNEPP